MNGLVLLGGGAILFVAAYFLYGRYLRQLFGIDNSRETPAHTKRDDVDYVPTKLPVLFGHHFASIAGAGPIVGPIAALYFGWAPVVIWIVVGCILVGAFHDFAALFLSVRDGGRSIGHVIERQIGYVGRQLFMLFCWAALILVVAVFASIVAKTFVATPAAATSSLLFIGMAPLFGWLVYRRGLGEVKGSLIFVPLMFLFVWVGVLAPLDLSALLGVEKGTAINIWVVILFAYVFVASVIPVWLLLQPRDYLNSFLLYAMLILGFVGVIVAAPTVKIPAFNGWVVERGGQPIFLFPILFVTVACGACSGFHALVASGTTAKQLGEERHILPIGYGSMLVEGVLAIMALLSVAYLSGDQAAAIVKAKTPVGAFSSGLAHFCSGFGLPTEIGATFFSLAVSAFLLTTLDTATRLARFTWQELCLPREGSQKASGGVRSVLRNRYVATAGVVGIAAYLVMAKYTTPSGTVIAAWKVIWPVFGASNQLLAALTLLAVTVVLVRLRKNYIVALVPMLFMMAVSGWGLWQLFRANVADRNIPMIMATGFLLAMALVLVIQSVIALIASRRTTQEEEGA